MTPSILVVVVNYRTGDLAIGAVRSIAADVAKRDDIHVTVVDNGSADGSAERIAMGIDAMGAHAWCNLLALDTNGGFAAGNNAALRQFERTPDLVWLLNPDTVADPGALDAIVRFMEERADVGIAGGRCRLPDGQIWRSAFRFHSPLGDLVDALGFGPLTRQLRRYEVAIAPIDIPIPVDWVSGSHMMIRGSVIHAIGPMDERYFLYFEETAYCAKAAAAGFTCWHVPQSTVMHIGGQATGVTGATTVRRRPRYWFESRARFFIERYGRARTHLANFLWLMAYPLGRGIAALRGRPKNDPPWLWRDFLCHYYGRGGLMYGPRA
ncbi:MAG: glycosyl transferase, family 2 [Rhizorhabdus sp.]|nr:glycosyl transferase, family 2 [Rhizorhabdus sp.]